MPDTQHHFDLVIIGSGAAGLSAAVTAAYHGLKVVVVEKASTLGGATAWSGGWMWVPRNFLARGAGIHEDAATIRTYLRHELGERYDPARIDAFLEYAPRMVEFFHHKTALKFADGNAIADIHGNTPGTGTGGRSVIAAPFDGRELSRETLNKLRHTMPETAFLGMPIQAGADLMAFLTCMRSATSFWHVCKRFTRHLYDLARYGRAMQLVNGVALVGRLAKSAEELGVDMRVNSPAKRLIKEDHHNGTKVSGVVIDGPDGEQALHARGGVILAAGGFAWDIERRRALFPRTPSGKEHWPLPPPSTTGDGLRLGESAGGQVADDLYSAVAWAPVSLVPWNSSTQDQTHGGGRQQERIGHFPHIIDRAKPGIIAVLKNGKRFVNEADGYYDFVDAMLKAVPEGEEVCSWLICTHRFQRRYGIGITRPAPVPFRHWIKKGYLKAGNSLRELAAACAIDPDGLEATVAEYNRHAAQGEDPQFGRGSTPYNRKNGDPRHTPNPCVAALDEGPFYAIKVVPGSFGTFAGLKTNEHAQVLDAQAAPITGLYAAGTDMASIMGGYYPAGGINLGPAMTFGHIAALHATRQTLPTRTEDAHDCR